MQPESVERPLPPELYRELRDTSHHGKSRVVTEAVTEALRLHAEEDHEPALPLLVMAKKHAPRSVSVRELLGLTYYALGRWREAAREMAAYRRMSDRRDADHILADCERALGRPDKALEALHGLKPSEVDPDVYVEAIIVAAGALRDLGRVDDAIQVLERGPVRPAAVESFHLRLWYALGDALEAAGRRRDARGWWDLVYAEDPEFFDVAQRRLAARRSS